MSGNTKDQNSHEGRCERRRATNGGKTMDTTPEDRNSLAASLRAAFRSVVIEADEWRPLAEHVLALMELERRVERQAMREMLRNRLRGEPGLLERCLEWLDKREKL